MNEEILSIKIDYHIAHIFMIFFLLHQQIDTHYLWSIIAANVNLCVIKPIEIQINVLNALFNFDIIFRLIFAHCRQMDENDILILMSEDIKKVWINVSDIQNIQ
jgi:hypothetical protein